MYQKGEEATLMVANAGPKTDPQGNHKTFVRAGGMKKWVFDIQFSNGYKAEFTYPNAVQKIFVPGKTVAFKVIDINNFGPTIDAIFPEQGPGQVAMGGTSMAGHPAVFAFGFAKDLAPTVGWNSYYDVQAGADEIYRWLMEKKHGNG